MVKQKLLPSFQACWGKIWPPYVGPLKVFDSLFAHHT